MADNFEILRNCALFKNIESSKLPALLGCLGAKKSAYKKGETILAEGAPAQHLGIVLLGKVQIERIDYYGNRSILASVLPSEIFGESFACAGILQLPADVVATEDTSVLLLSARRITQTCSNACDFHSRMIFNLLKIVANKNLLFHQKIEITSKRSTREKLMAYLLLLAKNNGSSSFTVPFDRQQLADYLGVERSGLSAEIGKMSREKIILCKKNNFTLL